MFGNVTHLYVISDITLQAGGGIFFSLFFIMSVYLFLFLNNRIIFTDYGFVPVLTRGDRCVSVPQVMAAGTGRNMLNKIRPHYFPLVLTLLDHRNDIIKCSKLKGNHEPQASGSITTKFLTFYWRWMPLQLFLGTKVYRLKMDAILTIN